MPQITSSIKVQLTVPKSKIFALCFQFSTELSIMLLIKYWLLDISEEKARPILHDNLTGQ